MEEEGRKGEGVRSEQVGSESSRLRAGPHKMQLVLSNFHWPNIPPTSYMGPRSGVRARRADTDTRRAGKSARRLSKHRRHGEHQSVRR